MKSIINQNIINKYILDEFGEILNPPTKDEMIELISNDKLTLEQVKLWILFGGDLMIKGECGKTILHSASRMGQLNIVEYVLDKGNEINNIDVDYLDKFNETPLIYAVSKFGQLEVMNLLLDKGTNINHQNVFGWSSLYFACGWNRLEVVKVLVESGIDIYLKNNNDETALDIAKFFGYQEIVDYLTPFYNKQ